VLGNALGPKLVIFKFKQKVKYRRRTGHRQSLTRVRIDAIHPTVTAAPKRSASKAAPKVAAAKPARRKTAELKAAASEAAPDETSKKPRARRAAKPKAEE
jgi:large subunit ribosomal protein L21